MQPRVWVRRALDDGLIEGAVVAVAMKLDRDFAEIVLQSFNLGIKVGAMLRISARTLWRARR